MGIAGLLKGLQSVTEKRSVRDFSKQSLAIDASSWLHKSVYSISQTYVESHSRNPSGVPSKDCVQTSVRYVANRCQELLTNANIHKLYLVLDGSRCPLKVVTNDSREARRQQNLKDARQFTREGKRDKAQEKYKACIKINGALATAVAEAVTQRFARSGGKVVCVPSPYEADSQLVKLCMDGLTQAIVTEDSDVLVYCAACRVSFPILFKLDRDTGRCDVISMHWLLSSSPTSNASTTKHAIDREGKEKKEKGGAMVSILRSLTAREARCPGLGVRLFVQACVLAGCDYAPSQFSGVGLVTAFKHIRDNAHRPCQERFRHVLAGMNSKKFISAIDNNNNNNDNPTTSTTQAKANNTKEQIQKYEVLMSKSEAVFYYHPVIQVSNGRTLPLLTVNSTSDILNDTAVDLASEPPVSLEHNVSRYHPNMARFQDWSFLGSPDIFAECVATDGTDKGATRTRTTPSNVNGRDANQTFICNTNVNVPVSEIRIPKPPLPSTRGSNAPCPMVATSNPYKKKMHQADDAPNRRRKRDAPTPFFEIDTNRQPLHALSSPSGGNNGNHKKMPKGDPQTNMFSQFQYSTGKENELPSSPEQQQKQATACTGTNWMTTKNSYPRKGQDVRFVKPKFSKEGRKKPKFPKPEDKVRQESLFGTIDSSQELNVYPLPEIDSPRVLEPDTEFFGDAYNQSFEKSLGVCNGVPQLKLPISGRNHDTIDNDNYVDDNAIGIETHKQMLTGTNDRDTAGCDFLKQCEATIAGTGAGAGAGRMKIVSESPSLHDGDCDSVAIANVEKFAKTASQYNEQQYQEEEQQQVPLYGYSVNSEKEENINGMSGATIEQEQRQTDDDSYYPHTTGSKYWGGSSGSNHCSSKLNPNSRRVTRSPQSSPTLDEFRAAAGGQHNDTEKLHNAQDDIASFASQSPEYKKKSDRHLGHPNDVASDFSRSAASRKCTPYQSQVDMDRQSSSFYSQHTQHHQPQEVIDISADSNSENFQNSASNSASYPRIRSTLPKTPYQASQASSLRGFRSQGTNKAKEKKKRGPLDGFFHKQKQSKMPRTCSGSNNATQSQTAKQRSGGSSCNRNSIKSYYSLAWRSTNTNPNDDDSF